MSEHESTCICCGDQPAASGRTICQRCIDADCRIAVACNRMDDEA